MAHMTRDEVPLHARSCLPTGFEAKHEKNIDNSDSSVLGNLREGLIYIVAAKQLHTGEVDCFSANYIRSLIATFE